MKHIAILLAMLFITVSGYAQNLPVAWDELTSPDFVKAVEKAEGVCIIPIGVIEKHGPHLPLGTDVFTAQEISRRAAQKEYCIVFPFYYAGQIFEAKHQPGTIAYSPELMWQLLDETCKEISRNGIKKIIIVNGHGGNNSFLQYFCQAQLAKERDYVVYFFRNQVDDEIQKQLDEMLKSDFGGHADEEEASTMMDVRPDLVKAERANNEPGVDMDRLPLKMIYTGIWWYAKHPNHYAGDAKYANKALGELSVKQRVDALTEVIKTVKSDNKALELQNQFFKESNQPLKTTVK